MPVATNAGEGEVYPGGIGMVVREEGGERVMQSMVWGWPRPMKSKVTGQPIKPKAVNNVAELWNYPWKFIANRPERRCIIPLTGFAEAQGQKGSMTRTWLRVKNAPIFAWAGLWDHSDEWGDWYSGVMTDCNEAIRPVHNRMPMLLMPEDYEQWLHGSQADCQALKDRCFPDDLIVIEATQDPWFRPRSKL